MPTGGGRSVTLTGSDFPPFTSAFALASGDAHVQALAEDAVLSARMTYVGSGVPSVTGLADSYVNFECEQPAVTVAGTALTCVASAGAGADLQWSVGVGASGVEATALASTPRPFANTSFAPPRIASLASFAHASTGAGGPFQAYDTAGGELCSAPRSRR